MEKEDEAGGGRVSGHPLAPGWTPLVREQAGEGLPQVADGLGLGLVFTRGPALGSVGRAEAVSQGLRFAETERQGSLGVTRAGLLRK